MGEGEDEGSKTVPVLDLMGALHTRERYSQLESIWHDQKEEHRGTQIPRETPLRGR